MQELIDALKLLHNPQAAWVAIESELLNNNKIKELGEIEFLGGAILSITPERLKNSQMPAIREAAIAAWNLFEKDYKADAAIFNDHRVQLRSSVMGLLNSPKSV